MEFQEVILKDLVLLAHKTYQTLNKVHIPGNMVGEVKELQDACLAVLKRFTTEYGDDHGKDTEGEAGGG
jgi:hypothetical protein